MPTDLAHQLDPNDPNLRVRVTAANGRVLDVIVCQAEDGAIVLYLDPQSDADEELWEPTPERLRVNVGDGPAWNYPDEGTQAYGSTGQDLRVLREQAWNEGFEQGELSGEGDEWTQNPYRERSLCAMEGCRLFATVGYQVCGDHFHTLTRLLDPVRS